MVNPFVLVPGILKITATCFTEIKGAGDAGISTDFVIEIVDTKSINLNAGLKSELNLKANMDFSESNLAKPTAEQYELIKESIAGGLGPMPTLSKLN